MGNSAIEQLQRGVESWRGEFLEGFSLSDAPDFDDWIGHQRRDWQGQMETVLDRLSRLHADSGESARAIELASEWVRLNPLDERAYRRLIQAQADSGDRAAALRTYKECRAVLARELGVQPEPETQALAERLQTLSASPPCRVEADTASFDCDAHRRNARRKSRRILHSRRALSPRRKGISTGCRHSRRSGHRKTQLATEFMSWAVSHGADTTHGRAFEAGARLPYQPLIDAMRPRLERESDLRALLGPIWLAELSLVLPELRDRCRELPSLAGDDAAARTRLFEAWARLGQALATRAPLVLFLDDVQWADVTSLDVLRYAMRRWVQARAPVLLIVAVRSEAVMTTPAIGEWLTSLRRDVTVTERELGPLTFDDTVGFLHDLQRSRTTDQEFDEFARWLFTETSGQPFFVVEALRSLIEQGETYPQRSENGAWGVDTFVLAHREKRDALLPVGVRQVVQDRLSPLSSGARDLLVAASVLGQECRFERLCRVGQLEEEDALTALDRVLQGDYSAKSPAAERQEVAVTTRLLTTKSGMSSMRMRALRGGGSFTAVLSMCWKPNMRRPPSWRATHSPPVSTNRRFDGTLPLVTRQYAFWQLATR